MDTTRGTADRLDSWRDLIREHFVALDIAADRDDQFAGAVTSTALGPLRVAAVDSHDQCCVRTPGLARRDPDAYLQVGLVAAGEAVLHQDGRDAPLRDGDFAIYETTRPFTWELHGDWRLLVFTWPREEVALAEVESQRLTARALPGSAGLGGIVARMLRELVAAPPELSGAGAVRLSREVAELVTTVAGEHSDAGPASEDLLRRVDVYIADHLGDAGLCPETIARAHFVSTRQLHRLFAARGITVSRYVRAQRLDRSRADLVARADATVAEVARRWGFGDAASFSRAYRSRFGVPPSAARPSRSRASELRRFP
ncbi:helix-turn-helix domain-containing protein [Pseudonocardia sp.]|uniref:AraC-like ligand-binding domain-containing protein n=1 Tax=Pseudonocardia sp. TaxID=60912 RepID=UPI003D0E8178